MARSPCPAVIAFTWSLSFPFGSLAKFLTSLLAHLVADSYPVLAIIEESNDWLYALEEDLTNTLFRHFSSVRLS